MYVSLTLESLGSMFTPYYDYSLKKEEYNKCTLNEVKLIILVLQWVNIEKWQLLHNLKAAAVVSVLV